MTTTITVRGYKIRSASNRRYLVVIVRPRAVETTTMRFDREAGVMVAAPLTIPAGARVDRRSDNLATAHKRARSIGVSATSFVVVVDSVTGEEV